MRHAAIDKIEHLFGGDGGGHELARRGIVLQAFETLRQPARHARARFLGEVRDAVERMYGHDAGHDGKIDPRAADTFDVTLIDIVFEEELGDGAVGAGIDLFLEHVDVDLEAAALGMGFRIARDGNLEISDALQAADEIVGVGIALRMRLVFRIDAPGRIAAQRDDVANARVPVIARDLVDLRLRRRDAGEMGGGRNIRLAHEARHGLVRALAGRAARAIRHRDEFRRQRQKTRRSSPTGLSRPPRSSAGRTRTRPRSRDRRRCG